MPARDKLGIRVRRQPKPSVASVFDRRFHCRNVFGLRANKSPDFVDLQLFAGKVLKNPVLIPSGGDANIDNQFANSRFGNPRQTRDGADRHALAKEVDDLSAFAFVQPVHTGHYA